MKKNMRSTAAAVLFSAFAISCSTWFESKIPLDKDAEAGSLSQLLTPKKKIDRLESPRQVFASKGLLKDEIRVSWSEVPYAASYRLERAVAKKNLDGSWPSLDDLQFTAVTKYTVKTAYVDTILSQAGAANEEYGFRYYYRVQAENIGRGYKSSDFTKPLKADNYGSLFAPPKNLTADKGKSQREIKITWECEGSPRAFRIYRDTREDFTGAREIARVITASYTQSVSKSDQGVEFYYKVCAENASGNLSAQSSIAMGFALKEGAPATPSNVKVENGLGTSTTEINIKWDALPSPAAGTTLTYSLFRTSSEDSVYSSVKRDIPIGTTAYKDSSSLKPGVYYYYYVQAIAKKGDEVLKSSFSESGPKSSSPAVGFLLSPPANLEIAPADGGSSDQSHVKAVWTPAIGSGAPHNLSLKYNIYYSDTQNGTFISLVSGVTGTAAGGLLSLTVEKKNFYKISAVNAANLESVKSAVAAPVPEAPVNVTASKTAKLDKDFNHNDRGVYPVKITWEKPLHSTPAGYDVFRSVKPDSAFIKLNDAPVTALLYIDKNDGADAGEYYYYKVVSLNSLNQGKNANNPASDTEKKSWGYGALTRERWFKEYNKSIKSSQAKLTLMHKPNALDKLGSESKNGKISGTVSYSASGGLSGAMVTIHYENYCDARIMNNESFPEYFALTGNTDTSVNISANGNMSGTVVCTGMYPGEVAYGNIKITGGQAGGGYYVVKTKDTAGAAVLDEGNVNWRTGDE
ncbi:MAG: fibronectin type III domain-containing protein [Treponema sp.]